MLFDNRNAWNQDVENSQYTGAFMASRAIKPSSKGQA